MSYKGVNITLISKAIVDSIFEEGHKDYLLSLLTTMGDFELLELSRYISDNQPEPVSNGLNYNMSDLHIKLNNILADEKQ